MHRLKLHKVLIQSLSFSFDEKYLASLGGQDDNTLVIWDVSTALRNPLFAEISVSETSTSAVLRTGALHSARRRKPLLVVGPEVGVGNRLDRSGAQSATPEINYYIFGGT